MRYWGFDCFGDDANFLARQEEHLLSARAGEVDLRRWGRDEHAEAYAFRAGRAEDGVHVPHSSGSDRLL
jgi:hypothetical protein